MLKVYVKLPACMCTRLNAILFINIVFVLTKGILCFLLKYSSKYNKMNRSIWYFRPEKFRIALTFMEQEIIFRSC